MNGATPNPSSAVPAWLQEILPPWFAKRPAFTEAAFATIKSGIYSSGILAFAAFQDGNFTTFGGTVAWFGAHWWALVLAAIVAASRGKEAHGKAAGSPSG